MDFSQIAMDVLGSEAARNIIIAVFGLAATSIMGWVQKQKWANENTQKLLQDSYRELEGVVDAKYARAKDLKEKDGGKLSVASQQILKDEVISDLTKIAQETGLDAVKIIGPRLIGPAIAHTVRRLKGGIVGHDATVLPDGVANMFTPPVTPATPPTV